MLALSLAAENFSQWRPNATYSVQWVEVHTYVGDFTILKVLQLDLQGVVQSHR